ncbi:MAG: helix-turn-helix domain-containing protein [Ruminococcus sp.]|nr:helix-turn-helix domain-containing protein [Ruminococcus sp.]
MSIINRIIQIMDKKHLNQSELCNKLGIRDSTFSTWKTRGTDPPAKYILLICEYLNVSADYLLGKEEKNTNIINSYNEKQFDETIKQVSEAFSKLSFSDKTKVMSLIAELSEKNEK